ATTFLSYVKLTATGTVSSVRSSVPISVSTPDGDVSNTVFVDVVAPPAVTIAISPTSANVRVRQNRQFTATVQGTTNASVTWKVNGVVGGNSTVGTISAADLYRAPNSVPSPSTVTVSATSAADPTKTAAALVTVSKK